MVSLPPAQVCGRLGSSVWGGKRGTFSCLSPLAVHLFPQPADSHFWSCWCQSERETEEERWGKQGSSYLTCLTMALHALTKSVPFLWTLLGSWATSMWMFESKTVTLMICFPPAFCSLHRPLEIQSVNSLCRSLISLPLVLLDRSCKIFSWALAPSPL